MNFKSTMAILAISATVSTVACGTADTSKPATVRHGQAALSCNADNQVDRHDCNPIPQGHIETTVLGSCSLIPPFDPADIQRDQYQDQPDEIYYDMSIRELTVIRITSFDAWGKIVYTETQNKCQPEPKHFQISSTQGNEAFLAKKITYFLKTEEPNRCAPEMKCF